MNKRLSSIRERWYADLLGRALTAWERLACRCMAELPAHKAGQVEEQLARGQCCTAAGMVEAVRPHVPLLSDSVRMVLPDLPVWTHFDASDTDQRFVLVGYVARFVGEREVPGGVLSSVTGELRWVPVATLRYEYAMPPVSAFRADPELALRATIRVALHGHRWSFEDIGNAVPDHSGEAFCAALQSLVKDGTVLYSMGRYTVARRDSIDADPDQRIGLTPAGVAAADSLDHSAMKQGIMMRARLAYLREMADTAERAHNDLMRAVATAIEDLETLLG